ncbi:hypothetical protein LTR37_017843 [Vermiconidia calcicola]|uniref:Uncharacterized protein n=1 Tax=Vermiconidia calcicola TaxID=1690605 RepID=A0ACC3MKE5_9PEZI|nr:hypothetical protein LTR37_017843 [Vermiconidia calcicola]
MDQQRSLSQYGSDHFTRMSKHFVDMWSKPLHSVSHAEFNKMFSEHANWFDHAFLIHRKGHAGVEMLRERWLTTNQPFSVAITDIQPNANGTFVQAVAEGVFAEDLYTIKATKKPFTYQLCI